MDDMTLAALAEGIPGRGVGSGWQAVRISGMATDSRAVLPGDLFAALPGRHTHGLAYVKSAVAAGAVAVLLPAPPPVPERWTLLGYAACDPRRALSTMAARLYGHPGRRLRLVGVTGTNGKTTVVSMLAHLLRSSGRRASFWSTARVVGGGHDDRPRYTTPEAPDLHAFLADVAAHGDQDAVLEVSSHALALDRVADLRFAVAVVTSLSPDHLDFHGSYDAYVRAKRRLVETLDPSATVVLNGADPTVAAFARDASAPVVRYGVRGRSEAWAEAVEPEAHGVRFRLHVRGRSPSWTRVPMPGRHNVQNALAAVVAARALGVEPAVARRALPALTPPVRRVQADQVGPYTIINDVAMNRASYDAVLATVSALGRPVVVVNALRGNRGVDVNRDAARVLAEWASRHAGAMVVVTSSDAHVARLAVDYRVRDEEWAGFLDEAERRGLIVDAHRELAPAIGAAVRRLPAAGVLLLLGTFGMDDGPELARGLLEARWHAEAGGRRVDR